MTCKRYKPVLFRFLLTVYLFAVGFLCFASMESMSDVPSTIFGIPTDKLVHFCMFAPFVPLLFFSLDKKPKGTPELIEYLIVLASIGCIFAGLTEIIQGMTPYRCEDIKDFYADMTGIVLITLVIFIFEISFKRRPSR